ncbi:MAG: cytosine methyltransferase [Oscillospiraceae bacterium]|jgi:N6-adenosine-specific RNA methylase IME4|nr:cytosine methyltransferase [Oscillospiraceae bacterium]
MPNEQKKYGCIIADPPWNINQGGSYGAVNHYSLMTLEQIKAMPVADLCKENAHCWLWVTNGTLEYGYEVLRAWGFTPRSVFTWIKPRMGLGNYLRNATEHVLLGTCGKAPVLFNAQMNWGFFPVQNHSHKPEEFHKIAERCSPGSYHELFARRRYPGWSVWGNEVESDIEIPGYPVPDSSKTRNFKEAGGENE